MPRLALVLLGSMLLPAQEGGKSFLLLFTPARKTIFQDGTPEEGKVFASHRRYLEGLADSGKAVFGGPSLDRENPFGFVVVTARSEQEAQAMLDGDPTIKAGINRGRVQPFLTALDARGSLALNGAKSVYAIAKQYVLAAAEKMPADRYDYRPVDTVRTYAQTLGHIADTQYIICGGASGEFGKARELEKTKSAKEDLIASLKEAFDHCDAIYAKLTDPLARVKTGGAERTRVAWLDFNSLHTFEHYGNLATYLRMNGLVPPSSALAADVRK